METIQQFMQNYKKTIDPKFFSCKTLSENGTIEDI